MEVRALSDLTSARALRAELLALAIAAEESGRPETLRLVTPRLSMGRIEHEWRRAGDVLRPAIASRLRLEVVLPDGRARVFGAVSGEVVAVVPVGAGPGRLRLARRDVGFAVEKMLIWARLTRKGPITRTWVQRSAGCTYPAVATVLKRLGGAVIRHTDRRIELSQLPRDEWSRLFAVSRTARSTLRFVDRSGQPASAPELLTRIRKLAPGGVALGGVAAARHYVADLDLVGVPRLDVSVHAPARYADIRFVRQLDPALKQVTDPADPAILVLHFVRHEDPLFARAEPVPWADPVECLLDLHEAGLETQAVDFLDRLMVQPVSTA